MGIKGLLPFLSSIQENHHISEFSGQVVGIDGYCWLHRGIFGCALELAQGKTTHFYVTYFIKRLQLFLKYNVTPVVVFDGTVFPAKKDREIERKESREKYAKMGDEFYAKGEMKQSINCYQKSIDVTPFMASEVISECKKIGVSCVVAPYEADAQLAFLYKKKVINVVVSEDSDLLVFGCDRVFFKMDNEGNGVLIDTKNLNKITSLKNAFAQNVTFLQLCILAGCDYLPSIKGIGMATACKLVNKYSSITRTIKYLRFQKGNVLVDTSYELSFQNAQYYFLHHWVFDHIFGRIIHLSEQNSAQITINGELFKSPITDEIGLQIALGNLHPSLLTSMANNNFNDFKVLYENSKHEMLKNLIDCYKSTLIEKDIPNVSNIVINVVSPHRTNILSSSMPNITQEYSSQYFSMCDSPGDDIVLSPVVVNKLGRKYQENDEDIENFARNIATKSYIQSQPSLGVSANKTTNLPKIQLKMGLSKTQLTNRRQINISKTPNQKSLKDFGFKPI